MTAVRPSASEKAENPNLVRTRYKTEFDATQDFWPVHGKDGVDVSVARGRVSDALRLGLESAMRDAARKHSPSTLRQYVASLNHFGACQPRGVVSRWDLVSLRRYRRLLMTAFAHEDYLRHLRSLLNVWHSGGYEGVEETIVAELNRMKLKGAETGRAVRVSDPTAGPLTPDELSGLVHSLHDAAEAGHLTLEEYALAYLHVTTGRRPIQTCNLKCLDVIQGRQDASSTRPVQHVLGVPRAKQNGHGFRETRRGIDLSEEVFELFIAQRRGVEEALAAHLIEAGFTLQVADLERLKQLAPLFPHWPSVLQSLAAASTVHSLNGHSEALELLRNEAASNAWHFDPQAHGARIVQICEDVGAQSRDGSPLNVNATRLRYTKGTELTRAGLPENVVAWILDHSNSRNVKVYTDTLPEQAAQINGAVSKSVVLQAFASAFRGALVDAEGDAVGGDQPARSRLNYKAQPTATCGYLKQCGLDSGIPYACYVCMHFQPWLDGPHEAFLAELQVERVDLVASLGADSPVAKRRDLLIEAVKRVIYLVDERKKEIAEGSPADAATEETVA